MAAQPIPQMARPLNNEKTANLRGVVELLLENSSRINEAKPQKYWHPLSQATYGIEEIMEALDSLCSFRTTMWEKTLAFEAKFAEWHGSAHAIMVNSGSSADLLMCYGLLDPARPLLKPGDEILVPVVTWPTQIWSPMMAGLNVKLVDVSPETLNVRPETLAENITEKTKAIFLVHLMGLPCDMIGIMSLAKRHNIILLEDCCEAMGSTSGTWKVGQFGLAASFSFFFAHHMTTMEGGMIVTSDDDFARQLRIMRAHGWLRNVPASASELADYDVDPRYAFVDWGFNMRPTDLQAGFGLHQLDKVDAWNRRRHEMASIFYKEVLELNPYLAAPIHNPTVSWPSWFALPLMVHASAPFTRNRITAYLEHAGVETRPIVTGNVARHPVGKLFEQFQQSFPGADEIHYRGFYIGLSPLTTSQNLERLINLFKYPP